MYKILFMKSFIKSSHQLEQSGKFKKKELDDVLATLSSGKLLHASLRDHALRGDYVGSRECHIRGDVLLVYQRHDDVLVLIMVDIGTHHQLFGS